MDRADASSRLITAGVTMPLWRSERRNDSNESGAESGVPAPATAGPAPAPAPAPTSSLSVEDRYRLLAENTSDLVYQTAGLDIRWISPSVTTSLGWKPEDLVGQPATMLVSPNQDLRWVETNRTELAAGREVHQEMLLVHRDGTERWYLGHARPHSPSGDVVEGFTVNLRDVHEQVVAQRALAASERLFRSAVTYAGAGISMLDPDERVIEVNESYCRFLGRSEQELLGLTWQAVTHTDDIEAEQTLLSELKAGVRDSFRRVKRYVYADGSTRHGDLTVAAARDDDGHLILISAQVIDVTEQTLARQRLIELATVDPLTGMLNRATITQELNRALKGRRSPDDHIGILMIDLDNVTLVNESLGHTAGDSLIQAVAQKLIESLDPDVTLGRFGVDEFLAVVPGLANEAELDALAHRVTETLSSGLVVQGRPFVVTASIGGTLSQPASTGASLLQEADVALEQAKLDGRGHWRCFDLSMASAALRHLVLEGELRDAVERNEFVVYYQPIVQLEDGHRVGFEALVRWQHPTEGLLAPDAFLAVAEESGLIVAIGDFVLEQVCRDIAAHPELRDTFGVNVSSVQLHQAEWLAGVLATIEQYGADPHRLCFELTETAVMSTRRDLVTDLAALRERGVGIYVDDFGTGYSSITLLRDHPVTGLKLDRSFVATLNEDHSSAYALADGLAWLTRSIGLEGVAEGVETPVQAASLRAMGWNLGQGWLYGKPAPLNEWLEDGVTGTGLR